MDTFSHSLWGYGLFGHRGHPLLAMLFGSLPDLVSFGVYTIIRLTNGTYKPGPPAMSTIPEWCFATYDCFHSFVIAFLCIGLVYFWRKDIAFVMLAWPFHILLDFPFHTKHYFGTKLFWPLTDWAFDGVGWNHPWVFFPNVAGLVILLAWRIIQKRRGKLHLSNIDK